jgi:hypothetical protein
VSLGLRATARLPRTPWSLYLRAGGSWRNENTVDAVLEEHDGFGVYAGVGLEWHYLQGASLGLFAVRQEVEDSELEERTFGVAVRFRPHVWEGTWRKRRHAGAGVPRAPRGSRWQRRARPAAP